MVAVFVSRLADGDNHGAENVEHSSITLTMVTSE
jgi:hypothetical protein